MPPSLPTPTSPGVVSDGGSYSSSEKKKPVRRQAPSVGERRGPLHPTPGALPAPQDTETPYSTLNNLSQGLNNPLGGMMHGSAVGGLGNPIIMGGLGGSMMGGLGGSMMGSPYYGMMPPAAPMMGGPFAGLNQFLFGVQSLIFSLGQAVQIIGMNTQALSTILQSASTMLDHAVSSWHEMRMLEAAAASGKHIESTEERNRRRKLRALRWAMVAGVSYAFYRIMRRLFAPKARQQQMLTSQGAAHAMSPYYNPAPDPYASSRYGASNYGYNPSSSPYGMY